MGYNLLQRFKYLLHLRERERRLQVTLKPNTPLFLLDAPFSTDSVFKLDFMPIGRAIFN